MRLKFGGQQYRLVINWKLMVFYSLFMPLFLGLGYWQLNRAQDKASQQISYNARMAADPVDLEAADVQQDYVKVHLSGRYEQHHHFLLDNRTRQGRAGYEVISPFLLRETIYVGGPERRLAVDYVLLNRGWLAMGRSRDELPAIETPRGVQHIQAIIDSGSGKELVLKDSGYPRHWPKVIQRVDIPRMGEQLAGEMPGAAFGAMLRILPDAPGAFTTIWKPSNMSPEKHLGYALQWFSMSAALTILYFFATLKRVKS